jgi:hypothetical protein
MKKPRYTLNVSKEVSAAVMDLRAAELRKTGKHATVDEVLRKLLHLGKEKTS